MRNDENNEPKPKKNILIFEQNCLHWDCKRRRITRVICIWFSDNIVYRLIRRYTVLLAKKSVKGKKAIRKKVLFSLFCKE